MNAARIGKGLRLSGEWNNCFHPVVFSLNCVGSDHGRWIDYRRTVSYDTTDLRRARGVRLNCGRFFYASITHSRLTSHED